MSAGQAIFQNELINTLPITAPDVNPALIIAAGAENLRGSFSDSQLEGILAAYMQGLTPAFALAEVRRRSS